MNNNRFDVPTTNLFEQVLMIYARKLCAPKIGIQTVIVVRKWRERGISRLNKGLNLSFVFFCIKLGIKYGIGFHLGICCYYDRRFARKHFADLHRLEETWDKNFDEFLVCQYGDCRFTDCSISDALLHGALLRLWIHWCGRESILPICNVSCECVHDSLDLQPCRDGIRSIFCCYTPFEANDLVPKSQNYSTSHLDRILDLNGRHTVFLHGRG